MGFENPFIPALKGQGFLAPTTVSKAKEAAEEAKKCFLEDNPFYDNAAQDVYNMVYAQVYATAYCSWFV